MTFLLTEAGRAMVAQEVPSQVQERPRRKAPCLWRGLTLFPSEVSTVMNTSSTTSTGLVAPSLRLAYASDVYETSLLPELYEAIHSDLYYDTSVKEAFL